eukprot:jgi/Chlat1/2440/Chrsp17S02831
MNGRGPRPGAAAKEAEQAKRRKYNDHPPADKFIPLAAETHGLLGGAFNALIATCAKRAANGGVCDTTSEQGLALLERGAAVVAAVPGWAPLRTVPATAEEDAVLAGAS